MPSLRHFPLYDFFQCFLDIVTWKTLLAGCRYHKSKEAVEWAEYSARAALALNPSSAEVYVMLGNMYQRKKKKRKEKRKRKEKKEKEKEKRTNEQKKRLNGQGGLKTHFFSSENYFSLFLDRLSVFANFHELRFSNDKIK